MAYNITLPISTRKLKWLLYKPKAEQCGTQQWFVDSTSVLWSLNESRTLYLFFCTAALILFVCGWRQEVNRKLISRLLATAEVRRYPCAQSLLSSARSVADVQNTNNTSAVTITTRKPNHNALECYVELCVAILCNKNNSSSSKTAPKRLYDG